MSARDPPSLANWRLKDFRSDQEIIADVRRLGGLTAELIENQDFQDFAMLALWGDFRLIGGYRRDALSATRAALTAYVGDQDPGLSEKDTRAWSEHATSGFECRVFPGDHTLLPGGWGGDVLAHLASRLVAS